MRQVKLNINKEDISNRIIERNKIHIHTRFNFIKQHNGLRPNKMHLFIAPTHIGKSTLAHALINDLVEQNRNIKILLYLTEETVTDFETAIAGFVTNYEKLNKSLTVMVEDKSKDDKQIKDSIETTLFHGNYDLFIVDNLTTSKLYMDRKVDTQSEVSIWLKGLLQETTIFIIAHTTGNNYNTELLDETHIRGSKTITNITEFLYVMQPVRIGDRLTQFIRVIKHRGQSPANKFFRLEYDSQKKTIGSDRPADFEEFKELFRLRNKL
jgi:hypothetical protein